MATEFEENVGDAPKGMVARIGTSVTTLYDMFMRTSLGLKVLHTYYPDHGQFVKRLNDRYWKLSDEEVDRIVQTSPIEVVGKAQADKTARRLIQRHALQVAVMTMVCALPQNWLMWPLIAVDVIFYQHQLFKVSQELCIIYRRRDKWEKSGFNYGNMVDLILKIEDAFLSRQAKKGVGRAAQWMTKKGARFLQGPLKTFFRQLFKWSLVSATKGLAEKTLEILVLVACSVIAGLVSYWMFLPTAMRCRRYFADETVQEGE